MSSPKTTEGSGGRFPPTSGKTTITTSSISSKKAQGTSSASSSVKSKVSTGRPVPPPTSTTSSSAADTSPSTAKKTTRTLGARGAFTRAKTVVGLDVSSAESSRMKQDKDRVANWKRWGPYLSERQWSTVREDYSAWGNWYAKCFCCCFCLLVHNSLFLFTAGSISLMTMPAPGPTAGGRTVSLVSATGSVAFALVSPSGTRKTPF